MPELLRCEIFAGGRRAAAAAPVVEALRTACGQASDRTTGMSWFLSRTLLWGNEPVVVLVHEAGQPAAAVLFYGRRHLGIPTGLIKGGNKSGDGLVVAPAPRRLVALEAASDAMLAMPWVHTVLTSMRSVTPPDQEAGTPWRPGTAWHHRQVGTHLSLEGGFAGFLSRLRTRSRRNYRYFRRRADHELGLVFSPEMQGHETTQAVRELHAESMHPMPRSRALRLEAAIRGTPGCFAMGLRDGTGRWLSYISGWRQPEGTFVEWQLNHRQYEASSLSTVMRTYFLEHEAANGVTQVVFVGGTSAALGRYCAQDTCSDMIALRPGLHGFIARHLVTQLRPRSYAALMLRGAMPQA